MGSGASTSIGSFAPENKGKNAVSKTIRLRRMSASLSHNALDKPLDGSDLTTFEEAKAEVIRLRTFANNSLLAFQSRSSSYDLVSSILNEVKSLKVPDNNSFSRQAIVCNHHTRTLSEYKKKEILKPDSVRDLIFAAIKVNLLFSQCSEEELVEMVAAFSREEYDAGTAVVKQGDDGEHLFVVEEGTLDIFIKVEGAKKPEKIDDSTLTSGDSFGELALMYSRKRAATIIATSPTIVWAISRQDVHNIASHFKQLRLRNNENMVGNIVVEGRMMKEILTEHELDHFSMSLEHDTFEKGEVIVLQGTPGDSFFIVDEGVVGVYHKDEGVHAEDHEDHGEQIKLLRKGEAFCANALLSEEIREHTYIAESPTRVLTLEREDVVMVIGSLQGLLQRRIEDISKQEAALKEHLDEVEDLESFQKVDRGTNIQSIDEIERIKTIGLGSFGKVMLCRNKLNERVFALKCQSKEGIVGMSLQKTVLHELHIQVQFNHPNICKLFGFFQDDRYLYYCLELMIGGELYTHVMKREGRRLTEHEAKFYAGSVILAFTEIHSHNVVYRDLKPENICLDDRGYVKIVDFGLSKFIAHGLTFTMCGTPDYLAPEIILTEGHDMAVDFWALGVLLYELCHGCVPFKGDDPMEVYERILTMSAPVPRQFSKKLVDLLKKLFQTQFRRLGNIAGGIHAIMAHKFFNGFDWDGLKNMELDPKRIPIIPSIESDIDTSNFKPRGSSSITLDSIPVNCELKLPQLLGTPKVAEPTGEDRTKCIRAYKSSLATAASIRDRTGSE